MEELFHLVYNFFYSALNHLLNTLVIITTLFLILHKIGFVTRCVHKFAERELRKILNKTPVTIGKLQLDIIHGYAIISDLIIHSPQRDVWEWESPLIVRVGKIQVYFNLLTVIDPIAFYIKTWPLRDVYGALIEDVQFFVEKRQNVFNFHLLDQSLDISPPPPPPPSTNNTEKSLDKSTQVVSDITNNMDDSVITMTTASTSSANNSSIIESQPLQISNNAEQKANEIITSMLGAVSSIGKAANEGGKEAFSQALRSRTNTWVKNLKQYQSTKQLNLEQQSQFQQSSQTTKSTNQSGGGGGGGGGNGLQNIAKESLNIIRNVHHAIEKNVEEIKQQVDVFTKPPPKKPNWVVPRMDTIRLGYLVGRDLRIFTKSGLLHHTTTQTSENWSKPILLKELAFSSAELCPPITQRNDLNLPPIGLTPDRIVDVVVKKGLAEMAKTNAGRVFQTAFGEVFAWMDNKAIVSHHNSLKDNNITQGSSAFQ